MQLSRRSLLAGGAAAVATTAATGCTPKHASAPPALSADALQRREAAAREQLLLQAYDAALAAFPALAAQLSPLRQDHVLHLRALSPQPPTPSSSRVPAARTATEARLRIRALEQAAARDHAAGALAASRQLAPLLSSLSACEASHVVLL